MRNNRIKEKNETKSISSTIEDIDTFISDIYELRKSSLAKYKENGAGNQVYKDFRSSGKIENLRNLRDYLRDKELSIENLEEELASKKYLIYGLNVNGEIFRGYYDIAEDIPNGANPDTDPQIEFYGAERAEKPLPLILSTSITWLDENIIPMRKLSIIYAHAYVDEEDLHLYQTEEDKEKSNENFWEINTEPLYYGVFEIDGDTSDEFETKEEAIEWATEKVGEGWGHMSVFSEYYDPDTCEVHQETVWDSEKDLEESVKVSKKDTYAISIDKKIKSEIQETLKRKISDKPTATHYQEMLEKARYYRLKEGKVVQLGTITPLRYFEELSKATGEKIRRLILREKIEKKEKPTSFDLPVLDCASSNFDDKHNVYLIGEEYGWNTPFSALIITNATPLKEKVNDTSEADKLSNEELTDRVQWEVDDYFIYRNCVHCIMKDKSGLIDFADQLVVTVYTKNNKVGRVRTEGDNDSDTWEYIRGRQLNKVLQKAYDTAIKWCEENGLLVKTSNRLGKIAEKSSVGESVSRGIFNISNTAIKTLQEEGCAVEIGNNYYSCMMNGDDYARTVRITRETNWGTLDYIGIIDARLIRDFNDWVVDLRERIDREIKNDEKHYNITGDEKYLEDIQVAKEAISEATAIFDILFDLNVSRKLFVSASVAKESYLKRNNSKHLLEHNGNYKIGRLPEGVDIEMNPDRLEQSGVSYDLDMGSVMSDPHADLVFYGNYHLTQDDMRKIRGDDSFETTGHDYALRWAVRQRVWLFDLVEDIADGLEAEGVDTKNYEGGVMVVSTQREADRHNHKELDEYIYVTKRDIIDYGSWWKVDTFKTWNEFREFCIESFNQK